jgi:hypothetical protein
MALTDWVSKTASEWIGGIKKFLRFPYGPEDRPSLPYQLVNKFWTIESDTCDKLVVSVSAHTSPTDNDVWIDMNRVRHIHVVTTDYVCLSTDLLVVADDTAGGFSIGLVTLSTHPYKEVFVIKRTGTSTVYVRDGEEADVLSQKVAGAAVVTTTLKLSTAMETMHFFNDGSFWYDVNARVSV